jgi:hypothetical protein
MAISAPELPAPTVHEVIASGQSCLASSDDHGSERLFAHSIR